MAHGLDRLLEANTMLEDDGVSFFSLEMGRGLKSLPGTCKKGN